MIVDMRTYSCRAGTVGKQFALYQAHGLAAQTRHLGAPFAYLATEVGDVNSFVHMWVYEDLADRDRRRAAMQADPQWQEFLKLSGEAGYLIGQQNKIMKPAEFAPLRR